MNKAFLQLLLRWPKPYVTGADLMFALGKSRNSQKGVIKRAVQEGALVRLKRDFYLIRRELNKPAVDRFELAPILYGPSYVSLESALQFHGWIPEAVPVVTAVTCKKAKEFETPVGVFFYSHIPMTAFSMGVSQIEQEGWTLFVAEPWKAIADLIYVQDRSWKDVEALSLDMRIEMDKLGDSDWKLLEYLSTHYPSQKTRRALEKLRKHGH